MKFSIFFLNLLGCKYGKEARKIWGGGLNGCPTFIWNYQQSVCSVTLPCSSTFYSLFIPFFVLEILKFKYGTFFIRHSASISKFRWFEQPWSSTPLFVFFSEIAPSSSYEMNGLYFLHFSIHISYTINILGISGYFEQYSLAFHSIVCRSGHILNRENWCINFSSLIFPGGKLDKSDENLKVSKLRKSSSTSLFCFK